MRNPTRMISLAALAAAYTAEASAQSAAPSAPRPVVINQNLMRLTQQLGVAFTQTRLSYTAPPFPVQFVNTSPLDAALQPRATASPSLVSGSPAAVVPTTPANSYFTGQLMMLPAGTYSATANQTRVNLAGVSNNAGFTTQILIPSSVTPNLPTTAVAGTITVPSSTATAGSVIVHYNYTPTR